MQPATNSTVVMMQALRIHFFGRLSSLPLTSYISVKHSPPQNSMVQ